jgi:hypothetical protein
VNLSQKLILGASAIVFAASTTLAIVQPGDLGDDDVASSDTTSTTSSTTTSTTSTTTSSTTSTTAATSTSGTTGTTATTSTTVAPTTSTSAGSGMGATDAGQVRGDDEGIADTGIESMLGPGLGLLGAALLVRRATRRANP